MIHSPSDEPSNTMTVGTPAHFSHDWEEDGALSTTILAAIATVENVDVTSLDVTLHEYINTDALDAIFAPRYDGTPRQDGEFTFTCNGYLIRVTSEGQFTITDASAP